MLEPRGYLLMRHCIGDKELSVSIFMWLEEAVNSMCTLATAAANDNLLVCNETLRDLRVRAANMPASTRMEQSFSEESERSFS